MERITISLDDELAAQFDRFLARRGYRNRSEAIRDLLRGQLELERLTNHEEGECVGTLTYIYNHHERELASKLTRAQHHHHDLSLSTLHVHLDHDHCMETLVLNGPTRRVREFANSLISSPGVRHGKLYLVPVESDHKSHSHGQSQTPSSHSHKRPQT
ncbi:MAG: nickel-responsive transcriptional regulator NikR [Gammaproteobacteria bacterium]|nr:nickel-responsive transcriptional regulator NikR [Gammaproteobacteria bacterium]